MINGLPGWRAKSNVNLIAHPGIFADPFELLTWADKNRDLIGPSHLPKRISQIFVVIGKGELVLYKIARLPVTNLFQITLFVPDQGPGSHSGVHACELPGFWLFLIWGFSNKVILDPFYCEQLSIVEISNHPMMLEIFK